MTKRKPSRECLPCTSCMAPDHCLACLLCSTCLHVELARVAARKRQAMQDKNDEPNVEEDDATEANKEEKEEEEQAAPSTPRRGRNAKKARRGRGRKAATKATKAKKGAEVNDDDLDADAAEPAEGNDEDSDADDAKSGDEVELGPAPEVAVQAPPTEAAKPIEPTEPAASAEPAAPEPDVLARSPPGEEVIAQLLALGNMTPENLAAKAAATEPTPTEPAPTPVAPAVPQQQVLPPLETPAQSAWLALADPKDVVDDADVDADGNADGAEGNEAERPPRSAIVPPTPSSPAQKFTPTGLPPAIKVPLPGSVPPSGISSGIPPPTLANLQNKRASESDAASACLHVKKAKPIMPPGAHAAVGGKRPVMAGKSPIGLPHVQARKADQHDSDASDGSSASGSDGSTSEDEEEEEEDYKPPAAATKVTGGNKKGPTVKAAKKGSGAEDSDSVPNKRGPKKGSIRYVNPNPPYERKLCAPDDDPQELINLGFVPVKTLPTDHPARKNGERAPKAYDVRAHQARPAASAQAQTPRPRGRPPKATKDTDAVDATVSPKAAKAAKATPDVQARHARASTSGRSAIERVLLALIREVMCTVVNRTDNTHGQTIVDLIKVALQVGDAFTASTSAGGTAAKATPYDSLSDLEVRSLLDSFRCAMPDPEDPSDPSDPSSADSEVKTMQTISYMRKMAQRRFDGMPLLTAPAAPAAPADPAPSAAPAAPAAPAAQ